MKIKSPKLLIVSLISTFSTAFIGSVFTTSSIPNWYANLNKPFFNPPNWIFGPVWTILYILMALSLYFVWTKGNTKKIQLWVKMFYIHLFFNASWSIVFFGLKEIFTALLVIIVLWSLILYLIVNGLKIRKASSLLLVPYLAWVTFATVLNIFIWRLN